jgi:hypothetical protein
MKLKDLFESTGDENYQQLISAIKKYCPNNFKSLVNNNAIPLFRGDSLDFKYTDNTHVYHISDERSTPRRSLSGISFLNSYVSSSPLWADVPKRSIATICSTNFDLADAFGTRPYLIIPFDNVKTFAFSEDDWNDIFIKTRYNIGIQRFNNQISNLKSLINKTNEYMSKAEFNKLPKNIQLCLTDPVLNLDLAKPLKEEQISRLLDIFYQVYKEEKESETRYVTFYEDLFGFEPADKWIEDRVTPEKLKIELYNEYKSLKKTRAELPEIWFNGRFIALACAGDNKNPHTSDLPWSDWLKNLAKEVS